jgi:acyl dehydratase
MEFSQFRVGQVIDCGQRTVTETEILDFARRYDPQWFHTDPERATAGRYHGLIASGWHTCALAMQMAVDTVLGDSTSCGSPGLDSVKWLAPVRPDDVLVMQATVLELRRSSSGQYGVMKWRWDVRNAAGTIVLEVVSTSLFDITGAG